MHVRADTIKRIDVIPGMYDGACEVVIGGKSWAVYENADVIASRVNSALGAAPAPLPVPAEVSLIHTEQPCKCIVCYLHGNKAGAVPIEDAESAHRIICNRARQRLDLLREKIANSATVYPANKRWLATELQRILDGIPSFPPPSRDD